MLYKYLRSFVSDGGLREGAEIIANFGGDLASNPVKFPEGLIREYRVSEEID